MPHVSPCYYRAQRRAEERHTIPSSIFRFLFAPSPGARKKTSSCSYSILGVGQKKRYEAFWVRFWCVAYLRFVFARERTDMRGLIYRFGKTIGKKRHSWVVELFWSRYMRIDYMCWSFKCWQRGENRHRWVQSPFWFQCMRFNYMRVDRGEKEETYGIWRRNLKLIFGRRPGKRRDIAMLKLSFGVWIYLKCWERERRHPNWRCDFFSETIFHAYLLIKRDIERFTYKLTTKISMFSSVLSARGET